MENVFRVFYPEKIEQSEQHTVVLKDSPLKPFLNIVLLKGDRQHTNKYTNTHCVLYGRLAGYANTL